MKNKDNLKNATSLDDALKNCDSLDEFEMLFQAYLKNSYYQPSIPTDLPTALKQKGMEILPRLNDISIVNVQKTLCCKYSDATKVVAFLLLREVIERFPTENDYGNYVNATSSGSEQERKLFDKMKRITIGDILALSKQEQKRIPSGWLHDWLFVNKLTAPQDAEEKIDSIIAAKST